MHTDIIKQFKHSEDLVENNGKFWYYLDPPVTCQRIHYSKGFRIKQYLRVRMANPFQYLSNCGNIIFDVLEGKNLDTHLQEIDKGIDELRIVIASVKSEDTTKYDMLMRELVALRGLILDRFTQDGMLLG